MKNTLTTSTWLSAYLLISIPFVYFFLFNHYSIQQPEALLLLISALLIASPFVWLQRLHWLTQLLFLPILLTLSISFLPGLNSASILIAMFFISLSANMLLKANFSKIINIVSIIFLVTLFVFPLPTQLSDAIQKTNLSQSNIHQNLPPIIHIILDEHIGFGGWPNFPETQTAKQELKDFYLQRNFQLFTNAYSHYAHTYNSLPNLLNFTQIAQDNSYFTAAEAKADQRTLTTNAYFSELSKLGYQIRVYQSDYLNFCQASGANIVSCYTYPAASAKSIQKLTVGTPEKTLFLLKSFLMHSSFYDGLFKYYQYSVRPLAAKLGWDLPEWQWYQSRTCIIPFFTTMQQLKNDLNQNPQGTVFFMHLLAPHNPYAFNKNCQPLEPISNWQIDVGPFPTINSPSSYKHRYQLYAQQVGCVQTQLNNVFSELEKTNVFNQAIIIIHGDHGSRIIQHEPAVEAQTSLTQDDYLDTYSTLFAIKLPNQSGGLQQQSLALEQLLQWTLQIIKQQPSKFTETQPYVYLYAASGQNMLAKTFHMTQDLNDESLR